MDNVIYKCDLFLKDAKAVLFEQKLLMIDKYGLPETRKACLNLMTLDDPTFIHGLKKKPLYKEISAELKVELYEKFADSLQYARLSSDF